MVTRERRRRDRAVLVDAALHGESGIDAGFEPFDSIFAETSTVPLECTDASG